MSDSRLPDQASPTVACPLCARTLEPVWDTPKVAFNRCSSCRISFFDAGEFAQLAGSNEDPHADPATLMSVTLPQSIKCPRCAEKGTSTAFAFFAHKERPTARFAACPKCASMVVEDAHLAVLKTHERTRTLAARKEQNKRDAQATQAHLAYSQSHTLGSFLSSLAESPTVLLRQRREPWELLGIETRNKYDVLHANGFPLGYAVQQGRGFLPAVARYLFGHAHAFEVHLFDAQRVALAVARFPFRLFFRRMEITDPNGVCLGAVQARWSFLGSLYHIEDAQGRVGATLYRPLFSFWRFNVWRGVPGGARGRDLARIEKKWSGLVSEAFFDNDTFRISYEAEMDAGSSSGGNSGSSSSGGAMHERLTILLAAILVDIQHFERRASSRR